MIQSSNFLNICISFCLGVFLSYFIESDLAIVIWLALVGLALLIIYWNNLFIRLIIYSFYFVLIGIVYPQFLGRERLIVVSPDSDIVKYLNSLREIYAQSLARVLPEPQASLGAGLVVGTKSGFPKELKDAFINTGTIHLVAVSGFNITVVIRIFSEWFKSLGRKISFISGTIAILLFIVLVGGQASVVRAGIMGWLFLVAKLFYRLPNIVNALFFTGALMIIFEPQIIFKDIGFQLSFLSMLGLIYISPILSYVISNNKIHEYIPNIIMVAIRESISAQLAVSLLILGYFSRISLISLIPNTLIVPMIPFPMISGIVIGLLSAINFNSINLIAIPLDISLRYILKIIEYFNTIPYASIQITNFSWFWVVAGYILLGLIVYYMSNKYVKKT